VASHPEHLKDKHFKDFMSMVALGMQDGEQSQRLTCPVCLGGSGTEKSFTIRKEPGRLIYRCWRAGCDVKGAVEVTGASLVQAPAPLPKKEGIARPWTRRSTDLTNEGMRYFDRQFGLIADDLDDAQLQYCPEEDRYIFPVFAYAYRLRGHTVRTFNKGTRYPKWDHFPMVKTEPWMGWYARPWVSGTNETPIVVVEDPISALKVSRQFVCAYLCGTGLDFGKFMEISKRATSKRSIAFALDKDATEKAIKILQQFRLFHSGQVVSRILEKDLKYSSDSEIRSIILGEKATT
jgi:hypothetical protein